MKIEQVTMFNFSFLAEGSNFNFSVPATSKDEAIKVLSKCLHSIQEELKITPKAN